MDALEHSRERTRVGAYEIVRKLARGGMAELYLARSTEHADTIVVLKQILPRYAANPRYVQLFLDEAKLAASLDHPHIAAVHDVGTATGNSFFTMEYVHGQDLRSILRRTERTGQKAPVELAIQIGRAMASALHYAHERRQPDGTLLGVVHRDVSPSNILVSYDGAIKLVDFGVAKASSSSVRTRTGTLKGKVGYMSPEQARGAMIDRRSDVFSLGVVLWEMLALRRLFKADNDLATIHAIINTTPAPLSTFRSDCPPDLERIIARALAKDVEERYQTADEMHADLDALAKRDAGLFGTMPLQFLGELFALEIAAFREAQSAGMVTDFVLAAGDRTQQMPTLLTDPSFEGDDDRYEELDDFEEEDEDSDLVAAPILPPLAGLIESPSRPVDAADEKTQLGPIPDMPAVIAEPRDPHDFEPPTVLSPTYPDEPELPTATEIATLPDTFALPSVVVAHQTPPPMPRIGPPIVPPIVPPPPVAMTGYPTYPMPIDDAKTIDLRPDRKRLLLGGIIVGAIAILLAIIIAST